MNEPSYSINRLAQLSGLDRRTVTNRLASVKPVRETATAKHYALGDAMKALLATPKRSESDRQRWDRLRADLLQLELDEKARKLIPIEFSDFVFNHVVKTIKSGILSFYEVNEDARWRLLERIKEQVSLEKLPWEEFDHMLGKGDAPLVDAPTVQKPAGGQRSASAGQI